MISINLSLTGEQHRVLSDIGHHRRHCASVQTAHEAILAERLRQTVDHTAVQMRKRLHFHLHRVQRLADIDERHAA